MKNTVTFILLFISTSIQLNAQSFGVKAGYTASNFIDKIDGVTKSDNYKSRKGFNVGAFVDFDLNKSLTLNTGVHYLTKGFYIEEDITYNNNNVSFGGITLQNTSSTVNHKNNVNLSYIGIPVQLKIYQKINDKIKIYALGGGYLDFTLKAKSIVTETLVSGFIAPNTPNTVTKEYDIPIGLKKDTYSLLDYGVTFGLGGQFNSILLEANYNIGLNNVKHYYPGNQEGYNRHLNISLGYIFNKPKKEKS